MHHVAVTPKYTCSFIVSISNIVPLNLIADYLKMKWNNKGYLVINGIGRKKWNVLLERPTSFLSFSKRHFPENDG